MENHRLFSTPVIESMKAGIAIGKPVRGPVDLQIMPLLECNARCRFCPLFALPKTIKNESVPRFHVTPETLDYGLYQNLIHDLKSMGEVHRVHFTGGEPLLHPRLPDMISDMRENFPASEIVVVTNGINLSERLDDLLNAGVSKISVSLCGGTESSYRNVNPKAPPGEFAEVCEGLSKAAHSIIEKHPAVQLAVTTVINRHTYHEVRDLYEVVRSAGGQTLTFLPLVPFTIDGHEHLERLALTTDEFSTFWKDLSVVSTEAHRHSIYVGYCGSESDCGKILPGEENNANSCFTGYTFAMIWPDGTVRPCCACDASVGSLKERGFKEIWESASYAKFRDAALNDKSQLPDSCICSECGYVEENRIYRDHLGIQPTNMAKAS